MTRPLCHGMTVESLMKQASRCVGKASFETRQQAKRSKKGAEKRFGKSLRIYLCPVCEKYHLSTKEL